ncbi:ricin-type beta-trefoil lectin domain protein [Rivularia sp. UHCC 0363]|uniref:ricin-type beta-trefoil lectin domain protein n=1 Tax=Rivularia sp. UHCC 0363 TaxID=3110244 RepID=UPI002B2121BC|nr:ricin-type beta-trefoil lectin domain protein [Rivularia sp. UHCC 0363]MEA5597693.1 ricin-type beta-trefoil lectin domain protein [Rivularia sp. UHCC 0363]
MLNKAWFLASIGAVTISSLLISAPKAQAAETFFIDSKALNTNWNFRRIDGNPRMSIYQRRDDDRDQQFDRLPGNRGGILLRHGSTGRCLNARYLSNGAEINLWPCDGNDPDQNWNLVDVGQGRKVIKRTGTNLCIDAPTRDDSGKVHLWACDGNNNNQRWQSSAEQIQPPPPPPNLGGTPLLTQQSPQYFRNRLQFYGRQGNGYSATGYGSSVIGTNNFREGNCTWYAYGRLKELGFNPDNIMNGYPNANVWGSVLRNGARILNRNETPRLGDVAQWYINGQNHVAIVEKVENGYVTLSESQAYADYDGDVDGDRRLNAGTLHRVVRYTVNNPQRYIRLVNSRR